MRSAELERRFNELNFLMSEMNKKLSYLSDENEVLRNKLEEVERDNRSQQIEQLVYSNIEQLNKRLKALSDELYGYIDGQNAQVIRYVDDVREELGSRIQSLSDELYKYMEEQDRQILGHIDDARGNLGSRIQLLSDELYKYMEEQNGQILGHVEHMRADIENRIQLFSDDIYGYVDEKKSSCDNALDKYSKKMANDNWILEFYYDRMMSGIQMYMIEQACPGNRAKLKALRDTHMGEKCFIIGNGPSLKADDLEIIREKGIFSLASKGIYKIFKDTNWRPDIWGVSDLDYIEIKQNDLNKLEGFTKLVCAQSVITQGVLIKDAIYYPFIQAERSPKCFNRDILDGVHFYGTITGKLINIAVYMGFNEIYLLGCDNTLPTKIDASGKKVLDTSADSHFSKDYYSDSSEELKADKNVDVEESMKYVCDAFKDIKYFCDMFGVRVYNATRGGELEAFPRVNFDCIDW